MRGIVTIPVTLVGVGGRTRSRLRDHLRECGLLLQDPHELPRWLTAGGVRVLVANIRVSQGRRAAAEAVTAGVLVVALVPEVNGVWCRRALRSGAHGVAPEEGRHAPPYVAEVLSDVLAGWVRLPVSVAHDLVAPSRRVDLSADQIRWLRRLAEGATTRQLAARSNYSEREMYRLLNQLYRQIGVRNRAQAIAWAGRSGLLDPP